MLGQLFTGILSNNYSENFGKSPEANPWWNAMLIKLLNFVL